MKRYDVLIVGAGPASSDCAWRLKQGGANCLLLDQSNFPRDKPCAGWITPQVVSDLGLKTTEVHFSFTTLHRLHISQRGVPITLRGVQHAIRRIEFDQWLIHRSKTPFLVYKVREIHQTGDVFSIDGQFFGRHLVGAGGTHCPVYHPLFKPLSPRFSVLPKFLRWLVS
jgi:hypothetical protein